MFDCFNFASSNTKKFYKALIDTPIRFFNHSKQTQNEMRKIYRGETKERGLEMFFKCF